MFIYVVCLYIVLDIINIYNLKTFVYLCQIQFYKITFKNAYKIVFAQVYLNKVTSINIDNNYLKMIQK